ncbi:MAG: putative porin, partial [Gammaproteobacteria bacterium]|nr:putative porin [Gammaproteobacteria bacterium]
MRKTLLTASICTLFLPAVGFAGEREELLKLQATTMSLIEALVKEGVLSQEGADKLLAQAKQKAAAEVQRTAEQAPADAAQPAGNSQDVRVTYVPQFVRDEIRDQVRAELREDVAADVLAEAKNQQWGVPGVLPDWTNRIKLKGDLRLRGQGEYYAEDNGAYFDWQASNEDGANTLLNTTENRQKMRARLRLGVDATVTQNILAGVRLTTGDTDNPVSTNQSLGNYGNRYQMVVDQAYLRYDALTSDQQRWLRLWGGRIPNPWLSTDLVWDGDLGFEGVAGTLTKQISFGEGLYAEDETERSVFLTLGAFPLSTEKAYGSDDKWLYGAQVGTDWNFENRSKL